MGGASKPVKLYDLAGARDEWRISPFCWRIRMALAHKGLETETIPWRLVEKDKIISSNSITAPVIVDNGRAIADSWVIAEYLDATYPKSPLLDGNQARAYCRWIHHWAERVIHPLVVPIILKGVLKVLHPADMDYFRRTREASFGKPLEQVVDESPEALARLSGALAPVRRVLRESAFLSGSSPAFGDYIVFGTFQWARCCSERRLLEGKENPMIEWFERMLDLFGGLGRTAPAVSDANPEGSGRGVT
jgi:glutathione S-transferase